MPGQGEKQWKRQEPMRRKRKKSPLPDRQRLPAERQLPKQTPPQAGRRLPMRTGPQVELLPPEKKLPGAWLRAARMKPKRRTRTARTAIRLPRALAGHQWKLIARPAQPEPNLPAARLGGMGRPQNAPHARPTPPRQRRPP